MRNVLLGILLGGTGFTAGMVFMRVSKPAGAGILILALVGIAVCAWVKVRQLDRAQLQAQHRAAVLQEQEQDQGVRGT